MWTARAASASRLALCRKLRPPSARCRSFCPLGAHVRCGLAINIDRAGRLCDLQVFQRRALRRCSSERQGAGGTGGNVFSDGFFQAAVITVVGVITASSGVLAIYLDNEHEKVWLGSRGPFSLNRACAWFPLTACMGSGLLATLISLRIPGRIPAVAIDSKTHELLALPLSILLAFRFQGSYERWWSARKDLESLAGNVLAISMSATNDSLPMAGDGKFSAHQMRFLNMLDELCVLLDEAVMKGKEPHPANQPAEWPATHHLLEPDDIAAKTMAKDPVLWCLDTIIDLIRSGQRQGMYTAEEASDMYGKAQAILEQYRMCDMVTKQHTPAPFVVHMRTFLFFFCLTFPFTIMSSSSPWMIIPMQAVVSFSLMGIEFCSREMEHPFGSDEGDVPCRLVLSEVRAGIKHLREKHIFLMELVGH